LDAIPEGAFVLSGPVPEAGVADDSVEGGVDDKTGAGEEGTMVNPVPIGARDKTVGAVPIAEGALVFSEPVPEVGVADNNRAGAAVVEGTAVGPVPEIGAPLAPTAGANVAEKSAGATVFAGSAVGDGDRDGPAPVAEGLDDAFGAVDPRSGSITEGAVVGIVFGVDGAGERAGPDEVLGPFVSSDDGEIVRPLPASEGSGDDDEGDVNIDEGAVVASGEGEAVAGTGIELLFGCSAIGAGESDVGVVIEVLDGTSDIAGAFVVAPIGLLVVPLGAGEAVGVLPAIVDGACVDDPLVVGAAVIPPLLPSLEENALGAIVAVLLSLIGTAVGSNATSLQISGGFTERTHTPC